jgi:hypothetical protein
LKKVEKHLFYQILVTLQKHNLASHFTNKSFRASKEGLSRCPAVLRKGILDWLGIRSG